MNCSAIPPPNLTFTTEMLAIVVCYSAVFIIAFIGNSIMFLILFRNQLNRRHRRRVHLLLLHMTVAHLLVTLIYIPKEIIHNISVGWWGGDYLCRICKFFDVFGVVLSAAILMCLSLDRFNSIIFPLYVINAKRSITRMLTVAWMVSIVSSMPQLYIFGAATHPCFPWFTQCVSADIIGKISPNVTFWFSLINIIQVYFIPLIVIILCYGSILISVSLKTRENRANNFDANSTTPINTTPTFENSKTPKFLNSAKISLRNKANNLSTIKSLPFNYANLKTTQQNTTSSTTNCNNNNNSTLTPTKTTTTTTLRRTGGNDSFQKAKNRTLKMTIVLVLAFLLCWTPYTVAMFFHFLWNASGSQGRTISPLVSKFLYAFAVFNSAISPYLYGYFSFNIRDELKYLYICLSGGGYVVRKPTITTKSLSYITTGVPINDLSNNNNISPTKTILSTDKHILESLNKCDNCNLSKTIMTKKIRSQSVMPKEYHILKRAPHVGKINQESQPTTCCCCHIPSSTTNKNNNKNNKKMTNCETIILNYSKHVNYPEHSSFKANNCSGENISQTLHDGKNYNYNAKNLTSFENDKFLPTNKIILNSTNNEKENLLK